MTHRHSLPSLALHGCNRPLELKAKRTYRYLIFNINENDEVVRVESTGTDSDYDKFARSLPENECRYAVYDFDFTTDEGAEKNKIFFIAWSPDTARVRSKMVYSSNKDNLKRYLVGIQVDLQVTKYEEVSLDVLRSRAN